ncbi:hypothetical protein GRF59_08565 [Paenibacillus sp. HJL G12]|uniref:Glycosyltransferase family 4 protein n=1 Tax=Paenibacillus dendrobii TaxID=2691084 RepID=A0A7X3LHL6_9BACL|nr:glycosyltransferase family 4 protein [Paenibacillus dendrobii]MWV43688.1 hypothetical protein [Paenibacillus dendrobii]
MKETLIVISDYMEGEPVVASVRYAGIMKHLCERYELIVINDAKYGAGASRFSTTNYKYETADSILTQSMTRKAGKRAGGLRRFAENLLRNKWTLTAWRNYKYSKFKFDRMNAALYGQLDQLLAEKEIAAVFVTVPDVYALYVLDYIKNKSPHLQSVIEIRDIINHHIGEGNPHFVYRQAEQMISGLADGMIAVSEGIYQHYRIRNPAAVMQLITNGYDEQWFEDSVFQPVSRDAGMMTLVHLGSIYKGRNVKAMIEGLDLFCRRTGMKVTLHIAGLLDRQAIRDMDSAEYSADGVEIHVHGSMKHELAVRLLKQSDAAVILTHTQGSDFAIPGKTFEYIGACKPVMAVTEDRELISLVQGRYGECAKHDPQDISHALERLVGSEYDFSDRHKYSRKLQARRILDFLDHITLDIGKTIMTREV